MYSGQLIIKPISAKLTYDTEWFGSMDCYVKIVVGGNVYKTKPAHDQGKNPNWQETFTAMINGEQTMHVSIYDHDNGSADDYVGECQVPLQQVYMNKTVNNRYPLMRKGKGSGEIMIILEFYPNGGQGGMGMGGGMPMGQQMGGYGQMGGMPMGGQMGAMPMGGQMGGFGQPMGGQMGGYGQPMGGQMGGYGQPMGVMPMGGQMGGQMGYQQGGMGMGGFPPQGGMGMGGFPPQGGMGMGGQTGGYQPQGGMGGGYGGY